MPYIQLKGRFQYFETVGEGRSKRLIGKFTDGTGVIDLVWFRQNKDYANAVLDFAETISDREVRDAARRLRYPEFFR